MYPKYINMSDEQNNYSKKERLLNIVSKYPFSCDLIVCAFHAAVKSDRFESRVNPFPPEFIEGSNEKAVEALRKVLDKLPPLVILCKNIRHKEQFDHADLLDWLFNEVDPKTLELTETTHLNLPKDQQPELVFGIRASVTTDKAWNRRKKHRNSIHAFYGTHLENLYSILKDGLNPDFSIATAPLYGDGIYVTNQIAVSLLFSPFSEVWKMNMLGEKLRVLVLCEIIDDPSKVKRLRKQRANDDQMKFHYILVKDKAYVRVKYFFVYTKSMKKTYYFRNILRAFSLLFIVIILLGLYFDKLMFLMDMIGSYFLKEK